MTIKINKNSILFDLYFIFLIFTIINKEFIPFGIDLRVVCVIYGVFLLIYSFSRRKIKLTFDLNMKLVLLLYLFVAQSIVNQRVAIVNPEDTVRVAFLNIYNLYHILIIGLFRKNIRIGLVKYSMYIACFFLGWSMLWVLWGGELLFNGYQSYSGADENLSAYRLCGYGADPNYVTLVFALLIIIARIAEKNMIYRILIYLFSFFMICLSRSRTIITLSFILLLIYICFKLMKKKRKEMVLKIMMAFLGFIPCYFVVKSQLFSSSSMNIRIGLWKRALNYFWEHPLLGNGLTSIRSISFLSSSHWYVQCHSTYFQILCEHGIIALVLYFAVFYFMMKKNLNNGLFFVALLYFVWSFTYETMYLPYVILFMGVIPYCNNKVLN